MRETTGFRCQACGYATPKWLGRCPDCGEWNSLVEERRVPAKPGARPRPPAARPVLLAEISADGAERVRTGIGELDRVLGGGVVAGSLVLIGGDPGIGKSTLLLQASRALAEHAGPVLYVSGEESAAQVKLRAERLGIGAKAL
ncbi:MAG: AAA family ATPase, partial [Candidatus Rokubacteria bacterium]|nr:AAA family ATPase [Candidatus Rokubacteria bacterium]